MNKSTALPLSAFSFLLLLLILELNPAPLSAHAVYTFAYAEGDQICTMSYFSSQKDRVRNGEISMHASDKTLIESARTDSEGNHCFDSPAEPGDLYFVIEAGQGHRAEFKLPAAERPDAKPPSGQTAAETKPRESGDPPSSASSSSSSSASPASGLAASAAAGADAQEIRTIVREEVRSQVAPLARLLTEKFNDQSPTLRDVVGGLGWILGLFGVIIIARGGRGAPPKE
ncbi:MAG: hypothetical protein LBR53_09135 [Deltaproteobacteria bacterium]|jgi:nickel transport protein|nr:hypothetical protein [Deltaproteobacteria bacterium]